MTPFIAGMPAPFKAPDGTQLSARLCGPEDGPPLVLAHGLAMSSLAFAPQFRDLALARFRIIAPDLRGHGMSEDGDLEAYADPATWAGDLQAAVDAFAARPPLLVGWSFGGRVLCAYLAAGGKAAGAMFVSAVTDDVLPDGAKPHGVGASMLADMRAADDAVAIAATIAFVDGMAVRPLPPGMRDTLLASASAVSRPVRHALATLKSDNRALLERLNIPVVALHGAQDPLIRPAASRATANAVPGGRAVFLEGVGHAAFLEDPAAFAAEVTTLAEACGL